MNGGNSTYGQFYQTLYIIKKDFKSRWDEVMWYFNLTLGELDVGVKNNADGLIWRRDVFTSHINAQKQ